MSNFTNIKPAAAVTLNSSFVTGLSMGSKQYTLSTADLFTVPVVPSGKWFESAQTISHGVVYQPDTNLTGTTPCCTVVQNINSSGTLVAAATGPGYVCVPPNSTFIYVSANFGAGGTGLVEESSSGSSVFNVAYGGG